MRRAVGLCMLGRPMPVAHMDAAMFHDDCGFLARWPNVPTGNGGPADRRSAGRKALRLPGQPWHRLHGALAAEAIYLNVFAERNARMALDALAAGEIQPVEPAAAAEAHDFLLQPAIVNGTFAYWARQARKLTGTERP